MARMRTWGILVAVVVAVIAAGFYAAVNLNRYLNDNKDWIADRAQRAVGRQVQFDAVGVSFRGGLGVRVDNVRVSDDPRFSDLPFVRADAIIVRVKILPALFGRYEVARIVLEKPSLTIVRNAAGLNVASLGAAESDEPDTDAASKATAVLIAYLELADGRVQFVDDTVQPPSEVVAAQIDFTASDVALDRPIDLRMRAAVLGEVEQNLTLVGKIGPIDRSDAAATPLDVSLSLAPVRIESLRRIPELAAALPEGLAIEGPLALEAAAHGSAAKLNVDANVTATDARIAMADAFVKRPGVPFSFSITAVRQTDTIEISKAVLTLRDAELVTRGTIHAGDTLGYDLSTNGDRIALRGWNEVLPLLGDMKMDGEMAIDLHTKAAGGTPNVGGSITLSDFSLRNGALPAISGFSTTVRIDKGRITMPTSPLDLRGSPARIEAVVDGIAPLRATARVTSPALSAESLGLQQDAEHAADVFRNVDLGLTVKGTSQAPEISGSLTTAAGTLGGASYSDLVAQLRVQRSRAVLTPVSLTAFGGRMNGEGVYDFSKADNPTFNFEASADRVEVGQLLAWLVPGPDKLLVGTLTGKLSLAGSGNAWPSIRDSLVGGGQIDLADGAIEDVNVAEEVLRGLTGVPGLSALLSPELRRQYPQLFSTGRTSFEQLAGAVSIARGRIATDDLTMKARDYLLAGAGSVGLDRSLDFSATFEAGQQLTQALTKQVSAARYLADRAGRIRVPFRLKGTLPSVRAEPNLRVVETALKNAVVDNLTDALLGTQAAPSARQAPAAGDRTTKGNGTAPLDDGIRKGLGGLLGQ